MAIIKNGALIKPPLMRKDYEEINITIYEKDGVTRRNITNDTIVFEARLKSNDATPAIRKTSAVATEIVKTDAVNGWVKIIINTGDLDFVTRGITLKCNLTVTDSAGRPSTTLFDIEVIYRA